tara:strand:- start:283 stop:708 length:426 start_codon:yes stop_codon:yes gene_type:complete
MRRPDNRDRAIARIRRQAHDLAGLDSTIRSLRLHGNAHHQGLGHGGWCQLPGCLAEHHRLMQYNTGMQTAITGRIRASEVVGVLARKAHILSQHPNNMIGSIERQVMDHINETHDEVEAYMDFLIQEDKENEPLNSNVRQV